MTTPARTRRWTAAATVAAALLLGTAPALADGLTTRCQGAAGAVTVPGDLVIPAGASCDLTGTRIEGDVRVQAGADLLGKDLDIEGDLSAAAGSYLELRGGDVTGEIQLTGTYGAVLEGTGIGGRLIHRAGDGEGDGFLHAGAVEIGGSLTIRAGENYFEDSVVAGALDSRGSVFTDARSSFVDGSMLVREAAEGSMLCALSVQRGAELAANAGPVQIGADGPLADCDAGSTSIGGDLVVTDHSGGVRIADVIVLGDLHASGNRSAAELGDRVRVRGEILIEDSADSPRRETSSAERAVSEDRASDILELAEARRDDAEGRASATAADEALV